MLKKKHIYIPIEILVREINSKILFSLKLALKNYRIYIGSKTGIDKILNKKKFLNKAGIFFHKSQIINNRLYLKKIKKVCEKFVVLDEELGVGVPNINFTLKKRAIDIREIDCFFVIGNKMMKKLEQYNSYFKKNSLVTGWLKYDIYKNEYINLFKSEIDYIKKNYGSFYLFSSNYGALSKKGLLSRIKKDPKIKEYKNFQNKNNNYNTFLDSIEDFKYLKKKLLFFLKKSPNFKLVIRPHPADEKKDDWKIFKRFKNVKVINKFDIVPWIISSKGLIHRGCSTSIDSFFLNKPTFFFKPNRKLKTSEKNLTYKISTKIDDFSKIKNKNFTNSKNFKMIKNEIKFDKKTSSQNIINYLNKLKITKEYPINFPLYKNLIYYILPYLGKIRLKIQSIFKNEKIEKNQKISRFISLNEFREKIDLINSKKKIISIREVTREVFEIEKL